MSTTVITAASRQNMAARSSDRDGLLAWAERAGYRPAAEPPRGGLRFVFYGRVFEPRICRIR